jgi:RimJ/RimL family protein N-acetyltransferase
MHARRGPDRIATERLVLRRPDADDADAIFSRYASDPSVTRFVGWPRHLTVEDTRAFLRFSAGEWERAGAGPYLIESRDTGALLGSSGLLFESAFRAQTGFVLAKDAWGRGYATESLRAMIEVARALAVRRLYALCHHEHRASARVLEKCGFSLEGCLRSYAEFPNLGPVEPQDVACYAILL